MRGIMDRELIIPTPVLDKKETDTLDILKEKYEKLTEPSKIAKIGTKIGDFLPEKIKSVGNELSLSITEKELYSKMMEVIGTAFKAIEEQASKVSISETQILKKINQICEYQDVRNLNEICLVRSYDVATLVNSYKSQDIFAAVIEGGGTGALGFWGLPFNIALSTFLYFRAVQSIAMFYGYDVKRDSAELMIASEVFTNALSPMKSDVNNETTNIIGKIMLMSQAAVVKQTAKKTWTDMASRGGIPLLLTQLRALAHKSAQKALQNAGAKGLENSLFRDAFEQIGRKLTLKSIGKAVPIASAFFGALLDTAQMKKVLEYADIFYQKRFILEKESHIAILTEAQKVIKDVSLNDDEWMKSDIIEEI